MTGGVTRAIIIKIEGALAETNLTVEQAFLPVLFFWGQTGMSVLLSLF